MNAIEADCKPIEEIIRVQSWLSGEEAPESPSVVTIQIDDSDDDFSGDQSSIEISNCEDTKVGLKTRRKINF